MRIDVTVREALALVHDLQITQSNCLMTVIFFLSSIVLAKVERVARKIGQCQCHFRGIELSVWKKKDKDKNNKNVKGGANKFMLEKRKRRKRRRKHVY